MKKYSLKDYINSFLCMAQDEAALSIGISRSHLNRVMNGRKPAGYLLRKRLAEWGKGKIDLAKLAMIEPKK